LREATGVELGRVLGLLTHDLRNPLAALSSNVGFLQMVGTDFTDETKEAVDDLVLSVEALGRIIDSLELVGHELAERKPGATSSLEVSSLLRSVKSHAERGAQSHGVSIIWKTDGAERLRVQAMEQALLASLGALIHNALTVSPSAGEVVVEVLQEGTDIVFAVRDRGPGLVEELRERAFSAAAQPQIKSDRRVRYSRGLGLYAVARSAFLAGAKVVVVPQEEGSTIELVVPAS
jgi:signal transduction histidine kinase